MRNLNSMILKNSLFMVILANLKINDDIPYPKVLFLYKFKYFSVN